MSTNAISTSGQAAASGQTNLAAVYGSAAARGSHRHGGHGGKGSSGDSSEQGITVLASLVQALTQAASTQSAAPLQTCHPMCCPISTPRSRN